MSSPPLTSLVFPQWAFPSLGKQYRRRVSRSTLSSSTLVPTPHFFLDCVAFGCPSTPPWTSLVVQMVKRLPIMWETWVRSRGREDPLEKEMATHSSTLAWRIPWMEEPGGLKSMGSQRVRHYWATSLHFYTPFPFAWLTSFRLIYFRF